MARFDAVVPGGVIGNNTTAFLYVLMGQSNARGVAAIDQADATYMGTQPYLRIWVSGSSAFQALNAPSNNDGTDVQTFGPEMALAKTKQGSNGRMSYLVKYALGGTNLYSDWAPPSGTEWVAAKARIDAAISSLAGAGKTVVIPAAFWEQGESDSDTQAHADAYGTNLTAFIDNFKTTYTSYLSSDFRFCIGQMNNLRDSNEAWWRSVMFNQKNIAYARTDTQIINTYDLAVWNAAAPPYNIVGGANHLNAPSQVTLGTRFMQSYFYKKHFPEKREYPLTSITGEVVVLDSDSADDMSYATNSSSKAIEVSQWNNQVGSNNCTQSTSAARPLWFQRRRNQRDTVTLNGTSRYLTFGDVLDSTFSGSGKQFTIEVPLLLHVHSATTGAIVAKYSTISGDVLRSWAFQVASGKLQFVWQTNNGSAGRTMRTTSTLTESTYYHVLMTYDGTQTGGTDGSDRVKFYINGVQDTTVSVSPVSTLPDIPTTTAPLALGAIVKGDGSASTGWFSGEMGGLIINSGVESASGIAARYAFFKDKWGL